MFGNGIRKQKKMIAKYSKEPPTLSQFCLCENCKNNYVDNNICKGRHKTKIKHEITNIYNLKTYKSIRINKSKICHSMKNILLDD